MSHTHYTQFQNTYHPGEGFEFHPKLYTWLQEIWGLKGTEIIIIKEMGCNSSSCPYYETIVLAYEPGQEIPRQLKIGKSKNLITKLDLYFASQKQNNK